MLDAKDETPLLVPVLAALPVSVCMVILGLPAIGLQYAAAFRVLYFVACMAWIMPLALLQRALWRRRCGWLVMAPVLLAVSYAMSVLNNLLGQWLAIALGLETHYRWGSLLRGLDSCWLALVAFCACHAVGAYYLAYQRTQLRLAQATAAQRDAELRALRYQLNPHFLFNALNAVSALVAAHENRDANRMLGRVSDFLRATLAHDGRHEHALAEELALLEAYLEIEKVRLGARLRVSTRIGPDVLDAAVPYLLLQPLAENAIRHGIVPRQGGGQLDIGVTRVGEQLLVEVRNDGAAPAAPGGGGIGLPNVAERLRGMYGPMHRIDAGWRDDGRFHVQLALPLRAVEPLSPLSPVSA